MASKLGEMFDDERLIARIRKRLPYLFHLAELESSRAGKIGMEVGSLRERILVSLIIYKFGETNVDTEVPITKAETDVMLYGEPISIKTITGFGGVKMIWTVDPHKALEFRATYKPSCDWLLAQINWGGEGSLAFIPMEAQIAVLQALGRNKYVRLPKPRTNPRGVEMSSEALSILVRHERTKSIAVRWNHPSVDFNPYRRWLQQWRAD